MDYRTNTSWWILFFGKGCETIVGNHIKFSGDYETAIDRAIKYLHSVEYKDAMYYQVFTEKEYNINFK